MGIEIEYGESPIEYMFDSEFDFHDSLGLYIALEYSYRQCGAGYPITAVFDGDRQVSRGEVLSAIRTYAPAKRYAAIVSDINSVFPRSVALYRFQIPFSNVFQRLIKMHLEDLLADSNIYP